MKYEGMNVTVYICTVQYSAHGVFLHDLDSFQLQNYTVDNRIGKYDAYVVVFSK